MLHSPPPTNEKFPQALLLHPVPTIEQVPAPAFITAPTIAPPKHIFPLASKASEHPPQPTKSPTTKLLDIKVQGCVLHKLQPNTPVKLHNAVLPLPPPTNEQAAHALLPNPPPINEFAT